MADQPGVLERLATALAALWRPAGGFLDDEQVLGTFEDLGVLFPPQFLTTAAITNARTTVGNAADALAPAVHRLTDAIEAGHAVDMAAAATEVVTQVGRIEAALSEVAAAIRSAGPGLPGITQAQIDALVDGLPGKLVDRLLAAVLSPPVFTLLGVVERTFHSGDPTNPAAPPYESVSVHLDRLLPALTNPAGQLARLYGWGTGAFDAAKLFGVLEDVLTTAGLPALFIPAADGNPPQLQAFALDLTPTADGQGLRFEAVLPGSGAATVRPHGLQPWWDGNLAVNVDFPVGTSGELRPPFNLTVQPPSSGQLDGSATLSLTAKPEQPFVLIGQAGGSRLEVGAVTLSMGMELVVDLGTGHAHGVPTVSGELSGGKLVIDTSQGDGFIATVLRGLHLESDFQVGFVFDPAGGLRFTGGGGLQVQVPVHIELGPVEIQQVYLSASVDGGRVPVELSAGFTVALGPIKASVDRLGVLVDLSFPDGGGNVGPAQLDLGFKPPTGIGLEVDAGIVKGGGFLSADPDRGEYAGALQLEFAGLVELTAIGLISTRMPDGTNGFSLLVVIATEFGGGGIQLGYGFTLLAVGGVLGLNRGMNLTALVEGVRSGSIESVLFPKDVIANAPRVLSDLRAFFPPRQGSFLIGPMAKIGWGTPTLVSVSLGVIVEVPPGNVAILGLLKCVLPTEQLPLLVLQVAFVGALEVDKSRLWFYAEIFDSHILTVTIDGGMGLLVAWGDNPDFVLTVGGFHPSFRPPALPFPVPDRISVDILNRPGELIRVQGYFAVTSNTVQFGASAQLQLGFSEFFIEGHLSFDALFQISPFAFVIEVSAGVSLKAFGVGVFGIDLDFALSGPAPWRAKGRGSISLLFFEISADFDISWGEERDTTLPRVPVLPLLAREITKLEGWQTRLPTGGTNPLVTLRPPDDVGDPVLHPLGTLFIRQRALPLNVRIDRVGAQLPSDGKRFSVRPADTTLVQVSTVADKFAMAQFQTMTDAEKLSQSAYQNQDAGLEVAGAGGRLASARAVRRSTRYEQIIIDNRGQQPAPAARLLRAATTTRVRKPLVNISPAVHTQLLCGSSTSRSVLSQQDSSRRQPFAPDDTVRVADQRYVITYVRNNVPAVSPLDGPVSFLSETAANEAMADWIGADSSLAGQLHVVPESDAAASPAKPQTWTAGGDLPAALSDVDAVLLDNRKILIVGGADASGVPVNTAVLFDPVTTSWTATGSLTTARRGHTTTKLANGHVLVAGGLGADDQPLNSVEVYDPIAGTWTTSTALHEARAGHTATAFADGTIIVAGGVGANGTLASSERLNGNEWQLASMADARAGHQAVLLANGNVLVIGGSRWTGAGDTALAYCERYDASTGHWTPTGSLLVPRKGHQAIRLTDDRILVTGGDAVGLDANGVFNPDSVATAEICDSTGTTWTAAAPMPGGRSRHRAVRTRGGQVLVIGGTGISQGGYASVHVFNPNGTWTGTGGLTAGRAGFAAAELFDGRLLVAGGDTATTEVFTP
ncbi:DUF6603 domain-containing protein [Kutzneria chonburiensis]|uniref:DUF6603 domain-containing protein n=1 Tax=Kutzneria chonburiensis TaxID=1483604 RepID=A0ABV6MRJ5_9PSEU|nr:DUF6603 domain-containing protein [Kutzneria chonburiensis]